MNDDVVRVDQNPVAVAFALDANDVIVHVFRPEVRAFYDIEKMWAGSGARKQKPA